MLPPPTPPDSDAAAPPLTAVVNVGAGLGDAAAAPQSYRMAAATFRHSSSRNPGNASPEQCDRGVVNTKTVTTTYRESDILALQDMYVYNNSRGPLTCTYTLLHT